MNGKQQWLIFGIGLVIFIGSLVYGVFQQVDAGSDVSELQNRVVDLTNKLEIRRNDESTIKNNIIYKTTGIDPSRVTRDKVIAETFFEPAFSWTSGEEYDQARATYRDVLGADNPFVDVYLAENLTVDQYNYIDVNELHAAYDSLDVYALEQREDGNAIDYLGVITYYMVKGSSDLVQRSRLTSSQAIVRYTISGEGNDRTVRNVIAYPGFTDSVIEN